MAQDLKLTATTSGLFDLSIDATTKKYEVVEGFETAITVSLMTDARAPSSRVPQAGDRRGYIGDILTADIDRSLGSTLWTFDQSRLTQNIINQIRVSAEQAFTWMVDQGIILGVTATVTEVARGLNIAIELRRLDNTVERYERLWRLTNAA